MKTVQFRHEARKFVVANNQGLAALASGDLQTAQDLFTRWAATTKLPRASALARHNLAWTLIRKGEPRGAIEVHADNERRNERVLRLVGLWPLAGLHRSLAHALDGDVANADRWYTAARQRAAASASPSFTAMTVLVHAVILCRRAQPADAAKLLDDEWARCETALTGETLRPLRILRAFALATADARSAGLSEMQLLDLKPRWPREFAFLCARWPEMSAFLAAHDLVKADT